MADKKSLSVGDRVEFFPTHNKVKLTGTIEAIHEDDDIIEIDCDVDGKLVEVEHIEHAHVTEVTLLKKGRAQTARE